MKILNSDYNIGGYSKLEERKTRKFWEKLEFWKENQKILKKKIGKFWEKLASLETKIRKVWKKIVKFWGKFKNFVKKEHFEKVRTI